MNATPETPRYGIGEMLRITNVGCDCDPADHFNRCRHHQYVGDVVTISEITFEDETSPVYYVEENLEGWYEDELETVAMNPAWAVVR